MTNIKITDSYTEGMGERIRWVRVTNKLSQADLGDMLGVSRQSISGYETERLSPSRTVVHRMCKIYNTVPAWVFYGISEGMSGLLPHPNKTDLTPAQDALIALIMDDPEFARNLQRKLWGEAVALKSAEIPSDSA